MKVCVFGAGATGAHFAALLARSGADVGVIARGAHLAAMRASGIGIRTEAGLVHTPVRASDTPAELGAQDVVLVTLKSHALAAAAPSIQPLLGPRTSVVFLQNGIPWWYYHGHGGPREDQRLPRLDPGDALWQSIGPQRVVGGVTSTACTLVAPGVVEVKGGPRALTLGEPDGSDSARLRALAALLGQAGFPVETTPRIRDAIWSKLMLNLGSGPLAVLALAPLKDLFADQVLVDARFRILAEVGAIAEAAGCRVQVDFSAQMAFARGSSHLPSIAQDVAAGRQPEIETMFRAPLQMAREHGVATPTLDLLVALCTLKTRAMGLCA
jgi:2-dehydropantoate 2-reductase